MGKIHIYCGDGKGKTTAAIGLSVRATGQGYKVIFVQFLKTSPTGELQIFEKIDDIEVVRSEKPMKFTFLMNEQELEECRKINCNMLEQVLQREFTAQTLLVLDESIGSIHAGVLDEEKVLEFLGSKPMCEVVLTGRNPSDALVNMADYVTEMKKIKHPYDYAVDARRGIEF